MSESGISPMPCLLSPYRTSSTPLKKSGLFSIEQASGISPSTAFLRMASHYMCYGRFCAASYCKAGLPRTRRRNDKGTRNSMEWAIVILSPLRRSGSRLFRVGVDPSNRRRARMQRMTSADDERPIQMPVHRLTRFISSEKTWVICAGTLDWK